jgi:hypothetical protein
MFRQCSVFISYRADIAIVHGDSHHHCITKLYLVEVVILLNHLILSLSPNPLRLLWSGAVLDLSWMILQIIGCSGRFGRYHSQIVRSSAVCTKSVLVQSRCPSVLRTVLIIYVQSFIPSPAAISPPRPSTRALARNTL